MKGEITGYIDVAQVVLYVFWAFFAGLIFYLRREDRREGYPLMSEVTGVQEANVRGGSIWIPDPKTFVLPHGGVYSAPDPGRDDHRPVQARAVEVWAGAPIEPVGDALSSGVGPGAWAERSDTPDPDLKGRPKIVPMRVAREFQIVGRDPDPRGFEMIGSDKRVAGRVKDVWVDRSEVIIRYLEVDVAGVSPPRTVLIPLAFANIDGRRGVVTTKSIQANQFAGVPGLKNPEQITLREEDRIMGYYGAGYMYSTPARAESLL